ncbi:MAG TPA: adenosylcobinamide-GDP ribazoletransferase [Devosia sp.]|nr:adenosylcobinamide-GDP ribazoletransferase [Devosia sp.]
MNEGDADRIGDGEVRQPHVPLGAKPESGLKADFIMALRFFSRLPTGDSPHESPDLNRIAMALPLASLAIGVGPALLLIGAALLGLPAYFAAALAVGAAVMASGAMAEDALADSADGLFGGSASERRLEIMKDSRHGTYGVAALCLFIVLRVVGIGSVAVANPLAAAAIWLAAGIVGRSAALWLAVALGPARSDGAAATAGRLQKRSFAVGAVLALILLFVLGGPATSILALALALVLVVAVIAGWTALSARLVGGQTGDLIGALGALLEITVLTALLLFV